MVKAHVKAVPDTLKAQQDSKRNDIIKPFLSTH